MPFNIEPNNDFVLVVRYRTDEDEQTVGGIWQPGTAKEKETRVAVPAEVKATGPGLRNKAGTKRIPTGFREGDTVLVTRWGGYFVELPEPGHGGHGGVALIPAKDILGKLIEDDEGRLELAKESRILVPERLMKSNSN